MEKPRKMPPKDNSTNKNGPLKKAERNSSDDMEILGQIILETPAVRTQVILRLKEAEARQLKKG